MDEAAAACRSVCGQQLRGGWMLAPGWKALRLPREGAGVTPDEPRQSQDNQITGRLAPPVGNPARKKGWESYERAGCNIAKRYDQWGSKYLYSFVLCTPLNYRPFHKWSVVELLKQEVCKRLSSRPHRITGVSLSCVVKHFCPQRELNP